MDMGNLEDGIRWEKGSVGEKTAPQSLQGPLWFGLTTEEVSLLSSVAFFFLICVPSQQSEEANGDLSAAVQSHLRMYRATKANHQQGTH